VSRRSNATRVPNVHVSDAAFVEEVLAAICAETVRQVLTHRSKIAKTAPEELHEVRVGLRKLDTAIRLFSRNIPERQRKLITKELRWLRSELSSARNLDVFSADILNPFLTQPEAAPVAPVLHLAYRRELDQAYARATTALRSARFRRLIDGIRKLINSLEGSASSVVKSTQPAADVAARALKAMMKKMRMGRAARDLSRHDLHRFRLRTKRMRYAIGFTSGLFGKRAGKSAETMANALRDLQAYLGEITDMESHAKILNRLVKKAGQQSMSSRARLQAPLVVHQARRRERLLKKAAAAHRVFEAAKPFWTRPHR
jgi:triphosphatase